MLCTSYLRIKEGTLRPLALPPANRERKPFALLIPTVSGSTPKDIVHADAHGSSRQPRLTANGPRDFDRLRRRRA